MKFLIHFFSFTMFAVCNLTCTPFASAEKKIDSDYEMKWSPWVERYKKNFLEIACKGDSLLLSCYEVTKSDCNLAVVRSLDGCSYKEKKSMVNLAYDGDQIGAKIGTCVGEAYHKKFKLKTHQPTECTIRTD